jgi:hypothetical protein
MTLTVKTNLIRIDIANFLAALTVAILLNVTLAPPAHAERVADRTGGFGLGAAAGLQTSTPDGTAFALGLYGDYYLSRRFSIGPLLQIGLTGDLLQTGVSGQAKYAFDVAGFPELKPHVQAGIGFIHADLDRRESGREKDTSFLIPLGIGAEYKLSDSLWLDNTFLFNFTNLDVRNENFFFTWLIGLRF